MMEILYYCLDDLQIVEYEVFSGDKVINNEDDVELEEEFLEDDVEEILSLKRIRIMFVIIESVVIFLFLLQKGFNKNLVCFVKEES